MWSHLFSLKCFHIAEHDHKVACICPCCCNLRGGISYWRPWSLTLSFHFLFAPTVGYLSSILSKQTLSVALSPTAVKISCILCIWPHDAADFVWWKIPFFICNIQTMVSSSFCNTAWCVWQGCPSYPTFFQLLQVNCLLFPLLAALSEDKVELCCNTLTHCSHLSFALELPLLFVTLTLNIEVPPVENCDN